jgi:hypothetical protein
VSAASDRDAVIRRKLVRYKGEWVVFAGDRVVSHAPTRTQAIEAIRGNPNGRLEAIYSPRERFTDTIWSAY